MPYPALQPPPSDEGFLNKSLLDQLDAQADAEPVSSSASDDSSHDSPRVSYPPTHHHDQQHATMSAFYSRASFTAFPNATRVPARSNYREPPSASAPQFYPAQPDSYPQLTSPVLQSYDPRASFDFKTGYPPVDYVIPSAPQPLTKLNGYAAPYINGGMHSQTPYGPHIPSAHHMGAMNGVPSASMLPPPNNAQEDISTIFVVGFPEDMQEREFQNMFTFSAGFEAATLKIPNKEYTSYGIPPGGSQHQRALGGASQYNSYAGSNDPYNLVTVNQGGVVVDAGRDGISSWPAPPDDPAQQQGQPSAHGMQGGPPPAHFSAMPPRKQIIGFAKFRSREEALGAREVLQGRRIDIEKGAVLKAEMAKKNLHTKRGVGPVGGGGSGMGGINGVGLNGMNVGMSIGAGAMNGVGGMLDVYGDALSPRDRELVAMGLPPPGVASATNSNPHTSNHNTNPTAGLTNGVRMAQWRGTQVALEDEGAMAALHEQERERERRQAGMLSAMGLRGPRERAEDDRAARLGVSSEESERLRRRERERRASAALETLAQHREDSGAGPWDGVHQGTSAPAGRRSSSPSDDNANMSTSGSFVPQSDFAVPFAGEVPRAASSPPPPGEFVPHAQYAAGGYAQGQRSPFMAAPGYHEPFTQPQEQEQQSDVYQQQQQHPYHAHRQELSESSASDASTGTGDLERGMARLALRNSAVTNTTASSSNTNTAPGNAPIAIPGGSAGGSTSGSSGGSPQLASPASSGAGRAVDQNPPINTLYVGNLPSAGAGVTMEYLESALRELFSGCAGFRQMSFRPKANGPMCFVEFEDVGYATKTLNELYGSTLGGLIKGGGIRLSYSKNPLGVRTPTSACAAGGSLQQQQSIAAAEAAFHPRLTSPPPLQPPDSAYAPPYAAPRFFAAAPDGGAWGRRWESDQRTVPRALNGNVGVNGGGAMAGTGTGTMSFSPFAHSPAPPEPPAEGEAQ